MYNGKVELFLQCHSDVHQLYFTASETGYGYELWSASPIQAARVKDIYSGSSGSYPRNFAVMGNKLYFAADDGNFGEEIWVTDGYSLCTSLFSSHHNSTTLGTERLTDLYTSQSDSNPRKLIGIGNTLYFQARNTSSRDTLWKYTIEDGMILQSQH